MRRLGLSILTVASILLNFSGCNGSLPTPGTAETEVSKKLPKIVLTKSGVVVEMNEIAFEWEPVNDPEVEGIKVYKKVGDANITREIATIENRYSTHYVDLHVRPDTKYSYFFRTYSGDYVSPKSKTIVVYSKPPLPSVAWIYARNGLPRMAKLLWRPHRNQAVNYYIVERKDILEESWKQIAKVKGRLQAEYIDTDLEDKHIYYYRIRVETFDRIVSTPSEIVKVVTKPLPPIVTGLKASIDLPKRIELNWNKSNYKDFERYYLYRSKRKDGKYELIAKLYNNTFVDEIGEDGAKYFYKVSQKDIDGLESKKDDYIVMGATLPKLLAPKPKEAKFDGRAIHIGWFKVDPRSQSYIVERRAKTGWFDEKLTRFKTSKTEFVDTAIAPGTTYYYRVVALDRYGIASPPSEELKVEVKELRAVPEKAIRKPHGTKSAGKPSKEQEKSTVISPVDDLSVDSE